MLETKTKMWTVGNTVVVTIPMAIAKDSNFPFNINYNYNEKIKTIKPITVNIKIDGKKLVIGK